MRAEAIIPAGPAEIAPAPVILPSLRGEEEFTAKEKLLAWFLGIIVAGGLGWIGYKQVRKLIANRQERLSMVEGSSADFAKRIEMAFENDGWPGTDEEALREVIRQIPTKAEMDKVARSFEQLYREPLMKKLKRKLFTTEYNEMMSIIAQKPAKAGAAVDLSAQYTGWAARLKAAFDLDYGIFPGTDEEAIRAVFLEIPSKSAFNEVARVYQARYGTPLAQDLKSELEFWEYPEYMKIIQSKPE